MKGKKQKDVEKAQERLENMVERNERIYGFLRSCPEGREYLAIYDEIRNIEYFPGNKAEFEEFKGCEYEIVSMDDIKNKRSIAPARCYIDHGVELNLRDLKERMERYVLSMLKKGEQRDQGYGKVTKDYVYGEYKEGIKNCADELKRQYIDSGIVAIINYDYVAKKGLGLRKARDSGNDSEDNPSNRAKTQIYVYALEGGDSGDAKSNSKPEILYAVNGFYKYQDSWDKEPMYVIKEKMCDSIDELAKLVHNARHDGIFAHIHYNTSSAQFTFDLKNGCTSEDTNSYGWALIDWERRLDKHQKTRRVLTPKEFTELSGLVEKYDSEYTGTNIPDTKIKTLGD